MPSFFGQPQQPMGTMFGQQGGPEGAIPQALLMRLLQGQSGGLSQAQAPAGQMPGIPSPMPRPNPGMPLPQTPVNIPQIPNMSMMPMPNSAPHASPFASVLGNAGGAMMPQGQLPQPMMGQPMSAPMPNAIANSAMANEAVNGVPHSGGAMMPQMDDSGGDGMLDLGGLGKFDLKSFLSKMGPQLMSGRGF